eukprot:2689944-Pyramimonas_sp.AAC.1
MSFCKRIGRTLSRTRCWWHTCMQTLDWEDVARHLEFTICACSGVQGAGHPTTTHQRCTSRKIAGNQDREEKSGRAC